MMDFILGFQLTGTIGFYTYWIPLILCAIGYISKTIYQIRDLKTYSEHKKYVPDLTVGTVLFRVFLTVTPIVNVLALSFSIGMDMLTTILNWAGSLLDLTLVSKK